MAREWAVVLDALSTAAARRLGKALRGAGLDLDIDAEDARIWCFAEDEPGARAAQEVVLRLVEAAPEPTLQRPPMARAWDERHLRYVDPESPDTDPDTRAVLIGSELAPEDVT